MSLFDRLIYEASSGTSAEDAHLDENFAEIHVENDEPQQLDEMMLGGMVSRRYIDPRELQYQLEDVVTACERMWRDRRRFTKQLKPKQDAMLTALKKAASAAGDYADAQEKQREKV